MKLKNILLCALLLITIRSFGQNAVEKIRESYNNVQKTIKDMRAGEYPASLVDLTLKRNLGGSGPQTVKQVILFADDYDYETDVASVDIRFTTLSYNFAALQYYEEYLYDDDENLIFAYRRYPITDDEMCEIRIYIDKGQIIKLLVKNKAANEKQYQQTYNSDKVTEEYEQEVNDMRETGKVNVQLMKDIYKTLKR